MADRSHPVKLQGTAADAIEREPEKGEDALREDVTSGHAPAPVEGGSKKKKKKKKKAGAKKVVEEEQGGDEGEDEAVVEEQETEGQVAVTPGADEGVEQAVMVAEREEPQPAHALFDQEENSRDVFDRIAGDEGGVEPATIEDSTRHSSTNAVESTEEPTVENHTDEDVLVQAPAENQPEEDTPAPVVNDHAEDASPGIATADATTTVEQAEQTEGTVESHSIKPEDPADKLEAMFGGDASDQDVFAVIGETPAEAPSSHDGAKEQHDQHQPEAPSVKLEALFADEEEDVFAQLGEKVDVQVDLSEPPVQPEQTGNDATFAERDFSDLLAEFEDIEGESLQVEQSTTQATQSPQAISALFGDDSGPSAFDEIIAQPEPAQTVDVPASALADQVSATVEHNDEKDGDEPLDFKLPEGWYDDNGEWQWYTEEQKELVRLTMMDQAGWGEGAGETGDQPCECVVPSRI